MEFCQHHTERFGFIKHREFLRPTELQLHYERVWNQFHGEYEHSSFTSGVICVVEIRPFFSSDTPARSIAGTWPKPEKVLNRVCELLITNLDRLTVILNNFMITFQVLAYSPITMIFHLTVVSIRIVAQVLRIISSGHWTSRRLFFQGSVV